jgi:hypothetical protein
MRTVGHRKTKPLTFRGSADQLVEGARFNDELHRLPGGNAPLVRKGVYRFKTHEEANRHQLDSIVAAMVQLAFSRRR